MNNNAGTLNSKLDSLYNKAAFFLSRIRGKAVEDQINFRRVVVIMVLCLAAMVVILYILLPAAKDVSESLARNEYGQKLQQARSLAKSPSDKAAINLLGGCVAKNQYISINEIKFFSMERAERYCLMQTLSLAMLTNGPDKVREIAARYEALGFKVDAKLKSAIGLND